MCKFLENMKTNCKILNSSTLWNWICKVIKIDQKLIFYRVRLETLCEWKTLGMFPSVWGCHHHPETRTNTSQERSESQFHPVLKTLILLQTKQQWMWSCDWVGLVLSTGGFINSLYYAECANAWKGDYPGLIWRMIKPSVGDSEADGARASPGL